MGNQTGPAPNHAHELQELFRVIKNDSPNGILFLEEKSTGQEYLRKEITTNSMDNFNRMLSQFSARKKQGSSVAPSNHLLALRQIYSYTQKHFCSDVFKIFVLLEYPFRNLHEEIEERSHSNDWFTENEILTIIFSCCIGLREIYAANRKHEALMSSKIFIEKEGLIKIVDPYLIGQQPNPMSANEKTASQDHIYLSPEQLEFQQNPNHNYSPEQSDVFTLGMVILEAVHLQQMHDIYVQSNTRINKQRLQENINRIDGKYSVKLRSIVQSMLQFHPLARSTLQTIEQCIQSESFEDYSCPIKQSLKKAVASHRQSAPRKQSYSHNGILGENNMNSNNMAAHTRTPSDTFSKPYKLQNGSAIANKPILNSSNLQPRETMSTIIDKFKQSNLGSIQKQNTYQTTAHLNNDKTYIHTFSSNPSLSNLQHKYTPTPSLPSITTSEIPAINQPYSSYANSLSKFGSHPQTLSAYEPSFPKYTPSNFESNYDPKGHSVYAPYTDPALLTNLPISTPVFYSKPYVPPTSSYLTTTAFFPASINNTSSLLPSTSFGSLHLNNTSTICSYNIPNYGINIPFRTDLSKVKNQESRPTDIPSSMVNRSSFKESLSLTPNAIPKMTDEPSPVQQLETPERRDSPSDKDSKNPKPMNSFSSSNSMYHQITPLLPNSTIAEVTQTEMSGGNTAKHEDLQIEQSNSMVQVPIDESALQYEREEYEQGSRYEGYKLNGMRHGFGRFYYQDGGYYEGEWKHNRMHGFAKLYYQDGQIAYEGYWLNDQFHGKGKVYNDNPKTLSASFDYTNFAGLDEYWISYEGDFSEDSKHGSGCVRLSNGQVFEGAFDKDIIQGEGKYFTLGGQVVRGLWNDNRLIERY